MTLNDFKSNILMPLHFKGLRVADIIRNVLCL